MATPDSAAVHEIPFGLLRIVPPSPTTTTPEGRTPFFGEPTKVAELMAQLDGSVYVERVALYDSKQRNRAKKAIRKASKTMVAPAVRSTKPRSADDAHM